MDEQHNGANPVPEKKNQTKLIIIIGLVVLGLLLLNSLFSPERMTERMMEGAMDGEYDVDIDKDGSMKVSGGEDEQTISVSSGAAAKLPSDWPADISILPGAKIESSASLKEGEDKVHVVTLSTRENTESVIKYYEDKLTTDGWEVGSTVSFGDQSLLALTKGENNISIQASKNSDGSTSVTITTQIQ